MIYLIQRSVGSLRRKEAKTIDFFTQGMQYIIPLLNAVEKLLFDSHPLMLLYPAIAIAGLLIRFAKKSKL
jgi:hypothetical protein